MKSTLKRLISLVGCVALVVGCQGLSTNRRSPDAIPWRDFASTLRASNWSWSLPQMDSKLVAPELLERCRLDFKTYSADTLELERAQEDTREGLIYLVFVVKERFDSVLVYAYEPIKDRFRFKCFVPMA